MKTSLRTTSQLARSLGLSRWTVSRALNGHPGVSTETVARIQAAAREGGFVPSLLGRGLRSGQTNQVGICLPGLEDYFLTPKITLLHEHLQERGLQPLLRIVNGRPEDENSALERFAAMRCAGVIGIASGLDLLASGPRCLQTAEIPFVRIDPLVTPGPACVLTHRRAAMRDTVVFLHQLGHRRLVAAGFSPKGPYSREKIAGFRDGCKLVGWSFPRDIIVLDYPDAESNNFAAGALLGATWKAQQAAIPAIVAINDQVALGLMRHLQDHGLRIPRDVSVIGYDNTDFSSFVSPALTTIDPQIHLLISHALRFLLPSSEPKASEQKRVYVRPRLLTRGSHGPPPRR